MGWLTGNQIIDEVKNKNITISPFCESQVNPNSYDYRLGPIIKQIKPNSLHKGVPCIDPQIKSKYQETLIPKSGLLLIPGQAYLGHTRETFGSDLFASLITGKSSIARVFINNHHCAGLIDQGFFGFITLEITCQLPVLVYEGMRMGQIFWFETKGRPRLYHGKYQSYNVAQPSKIFMDIQK